MYEYKFTDKESEEITKKTKSIDDLFDNFSKIDDRYKIKDEITSNETLTLKRKEFVMPDEESIKKSAENSLSEYKNNTLKDIDNDYQKGVEAVDSNLETATKTKDNQKSSLEQAYARVKEDASNDAVKRGLARSSIIVNKLANYDDSMLKEFSEIEKSYTDTVTKLNNQKSQLEVQRQNALDGFDIAYVE